MPSLGRERTTASRRRPFRGWAVAGTRCLRRPKCRRVYGKSAAGSSTQRTPPPSPPTRPRERPLRVRLRARLPVDENLVSPALTANRGASARARHTRLSGRRARKPLPGRHASLSPPRLRGRQSRAPCRFRPRPQIRRDDPLNLSILLSGGKETNQDSLSSGERRGRSPAPNPRPAGGRGTCGVQKSACPASLGGLSPSDRGSARGRCEAGNGPRRAGARSSRSRVVWECSPKRVVNSI